METEAVAANDVRVPRPDRGHAFAVTRHGQREAVVVHPEDFEMLEHLDGILREQPRHELDLDDLALRIHAGQFDDDELDDAELESLGEALDR